MDLDIKPLIKKAGMTQAALAEKVGISASFLSEIMKGTKNPSVDTLHLIAQELHVHPGDLYARSKSFEKSQATDTPGFAEPPIAPLQIKQKTRRQALIDLIAPGARHTEIYRATTTLPAFGLLKGDILVIKQGIDPKPGDIVIATVEDMDSGTALTSIYRFAERWLIGSDENNGMLEYDPDSTAAAILGVVAGSLRTKHNL